ncbi:MAG: hypothetical protein ACKVTZ_11160 [Bacteroidia bacterium]
MAYSSFTLTKLRTKLGIKSVYQSIFSPIPPTLEPDFVLATDIEDGLSLPKGSEKSRSEYFIAPVFKGLRRLNSNQFTIFSGYNFEVDESLELNGYCDYLLNNQPNSLDIQATVFCAVEAKVQPLESGYGQCGAEMYAARLFNHENDFETPIIYGVVTSGTEWNFLKLEENTLLIDTHIYNIENLPQLMGVLQYIINFYKK